MNRIDRIKHMEELYDDAQSAVSELDNVIESFKAVIPKIEELINYYESSQWMKDFDADSQGKLPEDLKRGVLSEDGIYNLLTDYQRLKEIIKKAV